MQAEGKTVLTVANAGSTAPLPTLGGSVSLCVRGTRREESTWHPAGCGNPAEGGCMAHEERWGCQRRCSQVDGQALWSWRWG